MLSNATMDSGVLTATTPDCVAIIVLTAASVYKARVTASRRGLVITANTRHAQMNVTTEVNANSGVCKCDEGYRGVDCSRRHVEHGVCHVATGECNATKLQLKMLPLRGKCGARRKLQPKNMLRKLHKPKTW